MEKASLTRYYMDTQNKHPLIFGTFILTVTGFVSRIIGFFYRIYLARLFGEEGMGIYQLLNPVLSLSFSLAAAGYQTAISKMVAEDTARQHKNSFRPLFAGLSISLPLSFLCTAVIYRLADWIAFTLLQEPRTASMLRILAFSVPLSSVHSCINGYFYGKKKTAVPAAAQLVEQLIRVGCVFAMTSLTLSGGGYPTIDVAVFGLLVGEAFSMLVCVAAAYISYARQVGSLLQTKQIHMPSFSPSLYGGLLGMALPLTANRIVINLLQSVESVSIPSQLRVYGYDTATSLSVYGVLTGMAMPLIFFPNALTNSVAVLLLPLISESYALGDFRAVKSATLRTVKYCFLLGFFCLTLFGLFGRWAGEMLFDSALAGHFITTLSFICPFIYLDTTLSSILQGLGMAGHIFVMNVISLLLRLAFIFLAIPCFGITGYLWGLLASQLLQCLLYLGCLYSFYRKHKRNSVPS